MENMIWSYLLHLSTHMWDNENSKPRGWYLPPLFTPENKVDLDVWDETVNFLEKCRYNMVIVDVGDAVKYESHPEISAPDAWDKAFLKKKLDEMRAKGLEPIPKLNFSTGHHTWLKEYRRMVSSPVYYTVCADLIAEVSELFGYPRLFHLGMDEETPSVCGGYDVVVIRQDKVFWHDMHYFFEQVEKHGARPWVWSDYYWWGNADMFKEQMPHEVLQSNWYYHLFKELPASDIWSRCQACYEALDELGYEQVLTASAYHTGKNAFQTLMHGREKLDASRVKGYMMAPWQFTRDETRYALLNDAHRFYLARKEVYPDSF